VAVLTAMNVRRREAAEKRAHCADGSDPEHVADLAPSPEQTMSAASLAPLVRELLSELPEALAETLTLHVVLGYTVAEIAQSSGAPIETIRSRLRLAKRALRKRALDHPALREVLES
jgi:RNA polymerase sigma-70 factor (ECF subfamily)